MVPLSTETGTFIGSTARNTNTHRPRRDTRECDKHDKQQHWQQ